MSLPSFSRVAHIVARKQHECCECHGLIEPLDVYERHSGVWEGECYRFKTCGHCEATRDWLLNETDWLTSMCGGGIDGEGSAFVFTQLREHLQEQAREGDRKHAFRAYRFIVLMDRRRKAAKDKQ